MSLIKGNAVWITSEAEDLLGVYQYIVNLPDEMLEMLFYRLTFMPEEEIMAALALQSASPEQNLGKKRLAKEIISCITGSSLKADSVANYSNYFSLDFGLLVGHIITTRKRKAASSSKQSFN